MLKKGVACLAGRVAVTRVLTSMLVAGRVALVRVHTLVGRLLYALLGVLYESVCSPYPR